MRNASTSRTASEQKFDIIIKILKYIKVFANRLNALNAKGFKQPCDFEILETGKSFKFDLKECCKDKKYAVTFEKDQVKDLKLASLNKALAGFIIQFANYPKLKFLNIASFGSAKKWHYEELEDLESVLKGEALEITRNTINKYYYKSLKELKKTLRKLQQCK